MSQFQGDTEPSQGAQVDPKRVAVAWEVVAVFGLVFEGCDKHCQDCSGASGVGLGCCSDTRRLELV